jgi:hypothetical protein
MAPEPEQKGVNINRDRTFDGFSPLFSVSELAKVLDAILQKIATGAGIEQTSAKLPCADESS